MDKKLSWRVSRKIKENIIDDNTIFIDCGANAGFYSIPIAALNKECKIYSFEPSPIELNLFKNSMIMK